MDKDICLRIDELENYLKKYIDEHGMSIIELRFMIVLARMRYEIFNNATDFSELTVSAIISTRAHGAVEMGRKSPKLQEKISNFFYFLDSKSNNLRRLDIKGMGGYPENWKKYYSTFEEE